MSRIQTELEQVQEQPWVLAARRGDAEAFQKLIDVYDRRLLYFVRRFERDVDKASDIVQEIWLTVFRKIGRLHSAESFRTWLYRIAHAMVVTAIRREMRANEVKRSIEPRDPRSERDHERVLEAVARFVDVG